MKKFFFMAVMTAMSMSGQLMAQTHSIDSLKAEHLQDVVVMGVKANANAPFAVTNVNGKTLGEFSKTGRELPMLFAQTPGVLAWSENGLGTGTTYMSIRGAAGSRVNVTIDGISLNSPEDQCVFWANMNSYASLLGGVQIQRGVGTSSNGDGAFGGTVMLSTKTPMERPSLELSGSYGSFNTFNVGANFSTGMLWNHLIFDGAYHETNTDGYIHGTAGRSGSYYGGLTWYNTDRTMTIRYKNIGNFEKTGQAWNGVCPGDGDYSMNSYDGVRSYKQLYDMGLGRFNELYECFTPDWAGGYSVERYKMNDGSLWRGATDNFWQNHNILSMAYQFAERWSTSAAIHYTRGYGYYNELKYDAKLKKFGLADFTLSDGSVLKKHVDFVRKKGMTQDTYGLVWNVNYSDEDWTVVAGLAGQQFESNHFGYLTYISNKELAAAYMKEGKYQYYDSDASKGDMSTYLKVTDHVNKNFDAFVDLQYRMVNYLTDGTNDKFYDNYDGTYRNHKLNINKEYRFFNPKVGIDWHMNGHNAYASVAISNREPERNNFTDNGSYPAPKAERVFDYELGYNYTGKNFHVGANLYYMDYKNQFVQTGALSDIGEALTTNIDKSYRMGVELTAGWNVLPCLSIEGNAALSQNKIKDFTEIVDTYDDDWNSIDAITCHYDNSTLAFSPSAILNGFVNFHWKGFQAVWHTNFVSRQYLDNTECKERSLPSYTQSNVNLNYTINCGRKFIGMREIVLGCNLNNIFNRHYASRGWVYSAAVGKDYPVDNRYYQIGYIPMAGFTAMGSVTLKF